MQFKFQNLLPEAGCDEAGRGCLAGPVVAGAVILPPKFFHPDLNDSKKLTEKKRIELKKFILENVEHWAVAYVMQEEIDKINILNASIRAMHLALQKLQLRPSFIIVDGNKFKPYFDIPYKTIVKGDSKYMSIAAASILAKTFRDEYMEELHSKFPIYQWDNNKGYPTETHRAIVEKYGYSPHHRKSFKFKSPEKQLEISF